jgi:hypothetical protein
MALCSVTDCFFGVGFIGMMGSGKTTVGRVLSKSLGYYFFDRYFFCLKGFSHGFISFGIL